MIGRLDPDGVEVGYGDGRLTWWFANAAASMLAFDPDEVTIAAAREGAPEALAAKVSFRAADTETIELAPAAYDVAAFSWSI